MRLPHFTAGTLLDFSFSTRSRCKFAVKSLENGLNTRWRARGSRRGVPRQQGGVRGMAATLSFFAAALQKKIKNINNTQWPRGEANSWLLGVSGSDGRTFERYTSSYSSMVRRSYQCDRHNSIGIYFIPEKSQYQGSSCTLLLFDESSADDGHLMLAGSTWDGGVLLQK